MNLIKAIYLMKESDLPLHGDYRSDHQGAFVLGCGRSGTTLVRKILQVHPHLSSGPETHFFTKIDRWYSRFSGRSIRSHDWDWLKKLCNKFEVPPGEITRIREDSNSLPEFADRFFERFLLSEPARRWVEKTPGHVNHLNYLHRYFPRARLIHVIRNPLDVVTSLKTHPKWNLRHGERVRNTTTQPIEDCVDRWLNDVQSGLQGRELCPDHYTELHYEDLVRSFESEIREVLDFLGEEWHDDLHQFHREKDPSKNLPNNPRANKPIDDSRVGRWNEELTSEEVDYVKSNTRNLFKKLKYTAQDLDGCQLL